MNSYILALEREFHKNANPLIAAGHKAYLRDQFEFFGMTSPERREIQKPFLTKEFLPYKKDMVKIVKFCWEKPEREYHYFAMELVSRYSKQIEEKDIELLEYMILNNSWWDTVDYIAPTLMGNYFKKFPEKRNDYVEKWISSKHLWLQRSSIIFQLKYKKDLDTKLLSKAINSLLNENDFFIRKAIGWTLREYGKVNPEWVVEFVHKTKLSNLSIKEALRRINN